ncbi:hypothetical protein GIS00_09470 [Nakamurella sp. YIM 132087]|uniref:Uncharacterized protein n=1 Tax=Nakamurella alba TaxID=2665158 RepID=A0A7K1FLR0_9ACTN|nr:hypothetical protein [Nakamurella alba]MTD14173.1 hypothetical protein [Nakamurella alba]
MSAAAGMPGSFPPADVDTPRAVVLPQGGAWLRGFVLLAAAGLMAVSWVDTPVTGIAWLQGLAMAGLVIAAAAAPDSIAPLLVLLAAGGLRLFFGSAVLDGQLIWLVVLVPLVHVLAALAAVVPVRAELRAVALLPSAVRYAAAVLLTVVIMLLAIATGIVAYVG